MAGINPATGQFDPLYNGGGSAPALSNVAGAGSSTGTPAPAGAGVDYAAQQALAQAQALQANGGAMGAQAVAQAQTQLASVQAAAANNATANPPAPPPPPAPSAGDAAMAAYYKQLAAQATADRTAAQQSIIAAVSGVFTQYGLGSLVPLITQYAQQGLSADAIGLLIRQSPEYKQRFPAMSALVSKGRAISEAAYVAYEAQASSLERQFGLPQGMLTNSVTNLLTNEVSAQELTDRVQLASVGAIQAPADFKAEMQARFGIDQGGLVAHFLDPTIAEPLLQKQYAMAVLGTEASRVGVKGVTTDYLGLLNNEGISQQQAKQGFGNVALQTGLESGKGETVTQDNLVQAQFGTSPEAQQAVQRVVDTRVGAFKGGGGFSQDRSGSNRGLGVSATG